jgi:phosphoglycolate phosphatase-like HAD superfamily hydrolase
MSIGFAVFKQGGVVLNPRDNFREHPGIKPVLKFLRAKCIPMYLVGEHREMDDNLLRYFKERIGVEIITHLCQEAELTTDQAVFVATAEYDFDYCRDRGITCIGLGYGEHHTPSHNPLHQPQYLVQDHYELLLFLQKLIKK